MVWLISVLLLAIGCGLTVVTRWAGRRPVADDTLVTELLGPPPARRPRPVPQVREDTAPLPVPAAQPAGEGGWLDTQLAWITDWSQRMQEQIASATASPGADGEPARRDTWPPAPARPVGTDRRPGHGSAGPSRSPAAPRRCVATTVKGSRCKLPAEPAKTTCAIHAKRAHP